MTSSISSLLPLLLLLIPSLAHLALLTSAATDNASSLRLGSSLTHNQSLFSSNRRFQFGFFPLESGSSSFYLGVSYANLTPLTTAWIANRDKAVSSAAVCTFTAGGFVNLTDNGEIVWSIGRNASLFSLQDTGNVVLQSADNVTIWRSFDHPGNTWLPGMSLGPGEKLQCWLTPTNPTGGSYSLIMGDNNNFISVYNDTSQYWDSGSWNGLIFSKVPEMTSNFIYTFNFSNTTGFTYFVKASPYNVSKFVMGSTGLIVQSSYGVGQQKWNDFWSRPSDSCQVLRLCGQNSICNSNNQPNCACPAQGFRAVNQLEWDQQAFFHGCERKSPLNCSSTHESDDGFFPITQTSFNDWSFTSSMAIADLQQCKDLCLANCSCNGFFFDGDGAGNCSLFTNPLYDGTLSSSSLSGSFYLRVAATDLASDEEAGSKGKKSTALIVGIVVGAIAALVVVSLAAFLITRRRKIAAAKRPEPGLRAFTYAEMQAATKNFKKRLGGGGFGTVFEGVIAIEAEDFSGGSSGAANLAVAVKKLHRLDEGDKQFRAEVRTIGTIQHVNLIRLLGFCSEGKHRMLVYELAQNGSLDHVLFSDDNDHAASLGWDVRFNIALGAARGIAYLHESCRERIIHCDIKPENLLLDASYNVKVADFGLAKLIGREFSHVLTTLRGTRGYLAPEWIAGFPITGKADVYSFGMTILELLSGRRNMINEPNIAATMVQDDFFPVRTAQVIHQPEANLACLLDLRLEGRANMEELQRVAYCAIWCIQDNEDSRPPMGKIVQMLEGTLPLTIPPIPTSLQCLLETGSFDLQQSSSCFSQD
ncbi:hypothetical protein L7F22_016995 [Adiantum nelumboides]|nr:hypothetical protein [Adiantum nelumboides]